MQGKGALMSRACSLIGKVYENSCGFVGAIRIIEAFERIFAAA